jgi:hypothetical protein
MLPADHADHAERKNKSASFCVFCGQRISISIWRGAAAEHSGSPTPRQLCLEYNYDAIAEFGAASLFGEIFIKHQCFSTVTFASGVCGQRQLFFDISDN